MSARAPQGANLPASRGMSPLGEPSALSSVGLGPEGEGVLGGEEDPLMLLGTAQAKWGGPLLQLKVGKGVGVRRGGALPWAQGVGAQGRGGALVRAFWVRARVSALAAAALPGC